MNKFRQASLAAKLIMCQATARFLLCKIDEIEHDEKTPIETRRAKLKIIREEISKVGEEIDNAKKDITLLDNRNIN
jgi:hypothetical protein